MLHCLKILPCIWKKYSTDMNALQMHINVVLICQTFVPNYLIILGPSIRELQPGHKQYDHTTWLFNYGTHEFCSRLQRMCNCKSHSRHIKIKRTPSKVMRTIEYRFVEFGTDSNGTHLKLKKNCTRMFSETIKGFSWFWLTVICSYNYAFYVLCLVK